MKVLNASQTKKILVFSSVNPKEFSLLQQDKRLYIASKSVTSLLSKNLQMRSIGLFLGTLENKKVILSPSAADILL